MIAKLPDEHVTALDKRYGPITLTPRQFKFIDRSSPTAATSALNHTAGLSLPQQVMMTMFSLYELMDAKKAIRWPAWRSFTAAPWRCLRHGPAMFSRIRTSTRITP